MDKEKLSMFTLWRRGKGAVDYRYGEEWRAMQLMNEGGYKTPEEAKEAWEREQEKKDGR